MKGWRSLVVTVALLIGIIPVNQATGATLDDLEKQLQSLQKQIDEMKQEKLRQDQKLREVEAAQTAQKAELARETTSLREQTRPRLCSHILCFIPLSESKT